MNDLSSAVSSGADLWVVPSYKEHWWPQHIDWKINFQIAKSLARQSKSKSPLLQKIIDNCGLEIPNYKTNSETPLLLETSRQLPNRWVLLINNDWNSNESIKEIYHIWKTLNQPRLRIFLPKKIDRKDAQLKWKKLSDAIVDFHMEPDTND